MRGAIHGIWLVTKQGKLHPAIIPKFKQYTNEAMPQDFHVVLWTNTAQLSPEQLTELKDANIKFADPQFFKDASLYKYYDHFFKKGLKGDTSAFALASDILRMIILDYTANDKYFIYIDPNDIELQNLSANLQHINKFTKTNNLGFSFPVGLLSTDPEVFSIRNDVIIAYKKTNPQFFKLYLTAYLANLEKTYKEYKKPTNNEQAKLLASLISNQTATVFFALERKDNKVLVSSIVAAVGERYELVNSGYYLNYERTIKNANTWLPEEKYYNVAEEVKLHDQYLQSVQQQQDKSNNNALHMQSAAKASAGLLVLFLVCLILCKKKFKQQTHS